MLPAAAWMILGAWVVVGLTFTGLGALVRLACRVPARDATGWLACFWIGWATAVFFLQLWQLVLPIDRRAAIVLVAAGVAGLAAAGTAPWRVVARGLRRTWPAMIAYAVIVAWLANRALGGPQNGDSGLYHIPTMRWLAEFPLSIGLANLYIPFAFNHSYLLYLAALDVGPFVHRGTHLANSVLVAALAARVMLGIARLLRRRPVALDDLYWALLLPVIAELAFDINYTSPSPDLPVIVIGLVLTGHFVRVLAAPDDRPAPTFDLLAIAMLAALGVTVKLSLGGLTVTTLLLAAAFWLRHPRAAADGRGRTLAVAAALGAVGVIPWMVRGVLMSGYPLYPSTFAGVPVPWRVPPDAATWVLGASQIPGPYLLAFTTPQWFFTWLQNLGWTERDIVLPSALALAAGLLAVVLRVVTRRRFRISPLVLLPAFGQVVFLFMAAPRARYGGAAYWLLAVECGLLVLGNAVAGAGIGPRLLALGVACVLAAVPFSDGPALRRLAGFEPSPRPPLTAVRLETGLVVNYPGPSQTCWDGPLPCTPEPNRALRLRRPGELGSGFEMDPAIPSERAVPEPTPPTPGPAA